MKASVENMIKPGFFGTTAYADLRRREFDIRNEQLLYCGKKADIVFFGDSITQHWDLELYFEPSTLKINRGIGSDTAAFAKKRFDADVLQLDPTYIVILLGINDLLKIAPDLWNREPGADPKEILSQIEESFRDMLSKCTGRMVSICSILPQSLCPPYDRALFDQYIVKANAILRGIAQEYGAQYVDFYSEMAMDGLLPTQLTPDGVHPNAQGYAMMAKLLKEKIAIL